MMENKICEQCKGRGRYIRKYCGVDVCDIITPTKCGESCSGYIPYDSTNEHKFTCEVCKGKGIIYWIDEIFNGETYDRREDIMW